LGAIGKRKLTTTSLAVDYDHSFVGKPAKTTDDTPDERLTLEWL